MIPEPMQRKLFGLGVFVFASAISQTAIARDTRPHLNRAQSVINAFQVICQLELSNFTFERFDQKATAMGMQLQSNDSGPSAGNTVTRSKSWAGALTDGPFILLLDEMTGAKGKTTSCAIVADVPDRDAFRTEAIRTMKLPDAPAPELRNNGSRSYFWDGAFGAGTTVLDRALRRTESPGLC